jgi:hypothetical protein
MSLKQTKILNEVPQRSFIIEETFKLLSYHKIWLMSWGARKFTKFKDTGLFFTVSGFHHKGIVLITLAWDDTYTVTFLSSQWNVKDTFTNVYFDELAEVIDKKVERIADYKI